MKKQFNPGIADVIPPVHQFLKPILNVENVNKAYAHLVPFPVTKCAEIVLQDTREFYRKWREKVCKTSDIKIQTEWAQKFNTLLQSINCTEMTVSQWTQHFRYWIHYEMNDTPISSVH